MATQQSLFGTTPEALQQQRAAALNQEAAQYASMDPLQRASFGIYKGANQLAGAVGGMLGGQDPQMQRMQQRQQLLQGISPNDPASLKQGIERAMSANDYPAAQEFATRLQDLQAKLASTSKDVAAAGREKQAAIPADIQKAELEAQLRQGIRALEGDESPEGLAKKQALTDKLTALTRTKESPLSEIGKLLEEQALLDPVKDKAKYDAYTARIKKITEKTKGIGTEIVEGMSPLLATFMKKQQEGAGTESGKDVAKNIALVEGKYEAKYAITDALDLLSKGIYAGGYAPLEEAIAKYGMGIVGDKQRLSNTQEFKSFLAEVVIPRLKDFGGSDTVEELNYLKAASGADTTNEATALFNMLSRADKKMQRGIERAARQNQELQAGKPISIGPTGAAQKPTRRYNPKTNTFETIGGK